MALIHDMKQAFDELGTEAFYLNHYELHDRIEHFSIEEWKMFITKPEISDWINSELKLLQRASLQKMLKNIENSKSTGQAQLIQQLQKYLETTTLNDTGPAFIYAYVPLSKEQEQAPNVEQIPEDIFTADAMPIHTLFAPERKDDDK